MMIWELSFNEKENILFVKIHGIFNLKSYTALMKDCLEVIKKQNCRRCLFDNSEIESQKMETLEIHSIPKLFAEWDVPRDLRIANVVSKEHKQDFDFLETVCVNNGYYSISIFLNKESALQWLKQ